MKIVFLTFESAFTWPPKKISIPLNKVRSIVEVSENETRVNGLNITGSFDTIMKQIQDSMNEK